MDKEVIEQKVKELIDILDFFGEIKEPIYGDYECPFGADHYRLSEATGGLGCWKWNCPLCGKEEQE